MPGHDFGKKCMALVCLAVLGSACGLASGPPPLSGAAPRGDLAQAPSHGQGREQVLTSDDLFTIYQAVLTGAVQDVTGPQLIRGALKGSRGAAVEVGMLPVESAILD